MVWARRPRLLVPSFRIGHVLMQRELTRLVVLSSLAVLLAACQHRGPIISVQRCALQCELDVINGTESSIDVWAVDAPGGIGRLIGSVGPSGHERLKLGNTQAGLPSSVYSFPVGAQEPVKYCRVTKRGELVLSVTC